MIVSGTLSNLKKFAESIFGSLMKLKIFVLLLSKKKQIKVKAVKLLRLMHRALKEVVDLPKKLIQKEKINFCGL